MINKDTKITRRSLLNSGLLLAAAHTPPASAAFALGAAQTQSATPAQAAPKAGQRDPRPNIIFIIADDLRHDDLSSTGHPYAKTPHLDRIAHEGVKFNNARCTTPLCSPSRASYQTGLYVHSHRIVNNDRNGQAELSHRLPTVSRILFNDGYESAFVGKWHMGFDDTVRPGFDYWVSFKAVGLYQNIVFNVNGVREQKRGYTTDFLNEYAVNFIEQPHSKPFVMHIGHKAPHLPYLPSPQDDGLYKDAPYHVPAIVPGDLEGKPVLHINPPPVDVLRVEGVTPEPMESRFGRPSDLASVTRDRARCVASMDRGVGMIFDALERTGQLDNTILIFTSDHGYLMGEHGIKEEKRWAYEPSIRVPMLMRYPKLIPAGSERNQNVLNIDIAPTLLDLAGVKSPTPMHGSSLLPVFRNSDAPLRDSFLCEYFLEKFVPGVPDWQSVSQSKWKYIHYPALTGMDELYDLSADPAEEKNVIGEASNREVLSQMKSELNRLLAASQANLSMV